MSGELIRWLNASASERQHHKSVAEVQRKSDLAEAQVAEIARVGKRTEFETMNLVRFSEAAEQVAPSGAQLYALIAVVTVTEMTNVIAQMNRPGGYKL